MKLFTKMLLLVVATLLVGAGATKAAGSWSGSSHVPLTASVSTQRSFSLIAARQAAIRSERNANLLRYEKIGRCRWVTPRRAACPVTFHAAIINGTAPVTLVFTDYVIRPVWAPDSLYVWAADLTQI